MSGFFKVVVKWSLVKEGWEIKGGDEELTHLNWIKDFVGSLDKMSKIMSCGRLKMMYWFCSSVFVIVCVFLCLCQVG